MTRRNFLVGAAAGFAGGKPWTGYNVDGGRLVQGPVLKLTALDDLAAAVDTHIVCAQFY